MINIKTYLDDIDKLCVKGNQLLKGLYVELAKSEPETDASRKIIEKYKSESFKDKYNAWYNESLCLIKQIMPDRVEDFKSYYKLSKRKELSYETYTVSDYLIGLIVKNQWGETKVNITSVVRKFEQQLMIVGSLKERFESSLYDIKQLLQVDLFDSEIATAYELEKKGFHRASGAIAGVVLEKHLSQVCENHCLVSKRKTPSINDLNQLLKDNDVIDTPEWRKIQYLADIRNKCDHGNEREPSHEEIEDLIQGVVRVMKNIF